jgi:hypothetical protein
MSADFSLLTVAASFHIINYPCVHAGPPEVPFYLAKGLVSAGMTCCRRVVGVSHDSSFEFQVWWDHQSTGLGPFRDAMELFFLNAVKGVFPFLHEPRVLFLGPSDVVLEILVDSIKVENADSWWEVETSWFRFDRMSSWQSSVFVRYLVMRVDKKSFGEDYYLLVVTLSFVY